jgi:hypothetical protein
MLPERATVFDIGVTQKILPGLELGADVYLKQTRDLIDDGQFGAALVLNGFNYEKAENVGVEMKAVYTDGNFRAYANWAWANQYATNIITNQYLFDPARIAFTSSNWIYTDHSQVWTGSGGISYLWNGTRWSADVIYGSGLRSGFANTDHNAPYAQVNTGLSREFQIPGWAPVVARFDVINLFDTSYAIRNGTGIGVFAPQYGPRRAYYLGLAQKFGPGANSSLPIGAVRPAGYGRQLASQRGMDGMISPHAAIGLASTSAPMRATPGAGSAPIRCFRMRRPAHRARPSRRRIRHPGSIAHSSAAQPGTTGNRTSGSPGLRATPSSRTSAHPPPPLATPAYAIQAFGVSILPCLQMSVTTSIGSAPCADAWAR